MSDAGRRPKQLPLALPHQAAYGRDDYLVGTSNRAAFELIDRWPDWPSAAVLLAGPVGSGKTHLVEIWRQAASATVVSAPTLTAQVVTALVAAGPVALEDAHAGFDETAVFHLFNAVLQAGSSLLITTRTWPQSWKLTLPDMASRLRAATPVEVQEPDDDLLRRVLVKLFSDRQVLVDPTVVEFLVVRMERSLSFAGRLVDELDRISLADRRPITRPLATLALETVGGNG